MQAAAFQNKKRERPGRDEGACDPHYENIALAFRNRDQSKPSQSAPTKQAPVQHKPLLDTTQVPPWLHRAIMILFILLAFIFLSCIILSALVLVKNSEMAKELLGLKGELSNVSNMVQRCQNEQRNQWMEIQRLIQEATRDIGTVRNKVQSGDDKLKTLLTDITHIKKTLEALEKKIHTQPSK
uniref:Mast cell expressed membrane protein 1 n=1 Tax=Nannospalax galili TaxID=1026970 RepID=A0A8C6QHA2_NANGA